METKIKSNLLRSIANVFETSKDCRLEPLAFKKMKTDLEIIQDYFKITKYQAFFVSNVFAMNYINNTVDLRDIIEHLNCNPVIIIEYLDELISLYNRGIVKRERTEFNQNKILAHDQLTIDNKIIEAILNNSQLPVIEKCKFDNLLDLLEEIETIAQHTEQYIIPQDRIYQRIQDIISNNLRFPLLQKINEMNLNLPDTFLYLYLLWKTLNGHESFFISMIIDMLFESSSKRIQYIQKLIANDNDLLKLKLLEIEPAKFFNDTEVRLTDYAVELLKLEGIDLSCPKTCNKNIIKPSAIAKKELFFSQKENVQIETLTNVLSINNCGEVQTRLKNKNMPYGICVLLHGPAGTGKTELVYQIARKTKREILHVDISQLKSMWFGESEKKIKMIFDDYHEYAKQCNELPLLLLNEADSVVSKRKNVLDSAIAQTENTIQNILLEEFEKFTGILFATTNMTQNIDDAFDRRFLYKVYLEKPSLDIKPKIWKSKLKMLSANDCTLLSSKYDFSGAQIENVVRKCEMFEVVHGKDPGMKEICDYCEAELITKNQRNNIGFAFSENETS